MTRCVALVILALALNAAPLHAQSSAFTVTAQSADVYKGPTTGSPVIGHASRDTVLTVARSLGSWNEVIWPDSPDGIGYVHVTMGRLNSASTTSPASTPSASPSARPVPAVASVSSSAPAPVPMSTGQRTPASPVPTGQRGNTISHVVGVGGLVGSMSSFGGTARWWGRNRFGVQVGVTRDSMTSDVAEGRVTSMQIEPAVVYRLFDRVRDYVWVRPYVGSALSFRHQSLSVPVPDPAQSSSDNGTGFRVFGGSEFTFATATQLGLSAEVGYRRLPTAFPGFEPDRWSVALAGHWYIK